MLAQGTAVDFILEVLSEIEGVQETFQQNVHFSDQELIDPLSERELEVLRMLLTELSTPEIAEELIISVNTIRSHIKNIYRKLGVHSRFEAVSKAKQLDLL